MVADELARRGFAALDPDYDPELSHWLDTDGRRTDLADGPTAPTKAWLRSHRWVWSRPCLEELLAASGAAMFVCGIAVNQHELLDLFTEVFLLRIDDRTQEDRLVAYDRAHPPGRNEAGRQQIREGRQAFESDMLQLGATPLDGTLPTRTVVDQILARLPVSKPAHDETSGTLRCAGADHPELGERQIDHYAGSQFQLGAGQRRAIDGSRSLSLRESNRSAAP